MISRVGGSEPRSMLWEALFDLDHVEARHILAPMVALVGCFFNGGCGCASRKRWQVPQITEKWWYAQENFARWWRTRRCGQRRSLIGARTASRSRRAREDPDRQGHAAISMDCAGLGSPNFAGVGDGASDRPGQAAFHGDGAARDADPAGTRAPIYPKDLWKPVQKAKKSPNPSSKSSSWAIRCAIPLGAQPMWRRQTSSLTDVGRLRGKSGVARVRHEADPSLE